MKWFFLYGKFVIVLLFLLLSSEPTSARLLGDYFTNDSAMWEIKMYQTEDETPYLAALNNKIKTISESIQKNKEFKEIATAYLAAPVVSGSNRSFGNSNSAVGLTINVLTALHAEKKARAERDKITTPEQIAFVNMIVEKMRADNNIKDANHVEKQMKKGKLSDKARPYIQKFLDISRLIETQRKDTINMINKWIASGETIKGAKIIFPDKEFPHNLLNCVDTIINLNWRPYEFAMAGTGRDNSDEGERYESASLNNKPEEWNWIEGSERESITQDYPIYLSYYKYVDYPQYKVIAEESGSSIYKVYDNTGALVYIRNGGLPYNIMNESDFLKKIYAFAYKNNYYNIKQDTPHAQHYIKNMAGLEKLTAKEENEANKAVSQLANAFTNSMKADLRYGKNSKKAKATREKSAATAVGALLGGSSFYDSKGRGWLNQIERDFSKIIDKPYKKERIDNTTYRDLYVDEDGNGLFEIITSYRQGSRPFTVVVNYEIRKISKRFFTQEQLKQYISLRNILN